MNEHQRCIELAAASIDFRLSPDEQRILRTHLAICDRCSATVGAIRDDASRLAAAPHPAAPDRVRAAVLGAAGARSTRTPGMRWALLATMLAGLLIIGSVVAGSVVDRLRGPQVPTPTLPTAIHRATPAPAPTDQQAPRPTATPGPAAGWRDLGDISAAFGGHSVVSVMSGPDGRLVAFGLDRAKAATMVWVSDDGLDWTATDQSTTFGSDVPTTGALGDPGMLVVGSAISTQAAQRAIWESSDGLTWTESADPSARLGTNAGDLTMAAGPAGTIVWRPSGTVWVSTDGTTWKKGDIGVQGVTDVSVDTAGFVAVGQSGSDAFLVTSANGTSWGTAHRQTAPAGTQVGIERSADGTEAGWIGDQRWQRTGDTWRAVPGATVPTVPGPASVVGGQAALVAMGAPTRSDAYRSWTWPGSGEWTVAQQAAEAGSGTPSVVAVAAHGTGWFVLTRRGGALNGWIVQP